MIPAGRRGTTTISARAVARIAQQAATEKGGAVGAVRGAATVRGGRADVSVRLALPWPGELSHRARAVQRHVASRTGELTGLTVRVARLGVVRLRRSEDSAVAPPPDEEGGGAPRRWWSPRSSPAAVIALLGAVQAAFLTSDVVAVHAFGHAPAGWRSDVVDRLSATRADALPVTVGAIVAVVAGLWLLLLAGTPGLRSRYVVAGFPSRRTVAVDRSAVASLVRDRVLDVAGVDTVRVRVGRRRVRVRAVLAFGDRAAAHEEARAAVLGAVDDCRLDRPLRCALRLRTARTWDPVPDENLVNASAPAADAPAGAEHGRKETR
ncbi:DUF6286 domain-containing protein [Streptomyces californicus]|uniref:DUF6286 domain-containing protein n=1 Tax=Streptomyces californicus TaxID=67351 RepID=UPI003825A83D